MTPYRVPSPPPPRPPRPAPDLALGAWRAFGAATGATCGCAMSAWLWGLHTPWWACATQIGTWTACVWLHWWFADRRRA